MKALMGVIIGFYLVVRTGRRLNKRNYALFGFMTFFALMTALYMLGYMFIAKKPVP